MAFWRKQRGPVWRDGERYVLAISPEERAVLVDLLAQLSQLLTGGESPAVARRLHPPAYHLETDREADEEFRRLMTDELVASRLAAITVVTAALTEGDRLDAEAFDAFLRSLNGVRLVLGTILDVSEDEDPTSFDPSQPMAAERNLYHYLSWLLDAALTA